MPTRHSPTGLPATTPTHRSRTLWVVLTAVLTAALLLVTYTVSAARLSDPLAPAPEPVPMVPAAPVPGGHPGGAAIKGVSWGWPTLTPEAAFTQKGDIFPSTVAEADADEPAYYRANACHVTPKLTEPGPDCVFGDRNGKTNVWVLGDSKVGQWFPALDVIAKREGWRLTVRTKSACPYAPSVTFKDQQDCVQYNAKIEALIRKAKPDMVITASGKTVSAMTNGYVKAWSHLRSVGVKKIVALYDSPSPGLKVPNCVQTKVAAGQISECAYTPTSSANDILKAAAAKVDGATYVDMADWVCPPSALSPKCAPVIGGVMVYRGGSHLTASYTATLTDALHTRLYRAGVANRQVQPDLVARVGGADRYSTAAQLADGHTAGTPVVVTSGQNFPDALSAAAQAGAAGVPVLLTRSTALPTATRVALEKLRPSSVTIVGGPAAVGREVEDQLAQLTAGPVTRVSGKDRYATSAELAATRPGPVPVVYVATGVAFPDALAAAARAGHAGVPVLLVRKNAVPAQTLAVLQQLRPEEVVIAGGETVVDATVAARLAQVAGSGSVTRVSGKDRYATAAELARTYPEQVDTVYVATAADYPDALAAAARAGSENGPVLLVAKDGIPAPTRSVLAELAPSRIVLVGSSGVVSNQVRWALERFLT